MLLIKTSALRKTSRTVFSWVILHAPYFDAAPIGILVDEQLSRVLIEEAF